jgi:transposase
MADVDEREPMPIRAPRLALSERPDGRGMGFSGAAYSAGEARRTQTRSECARGHERTFVRTGNGLPMAASAEGLSAEEHGAWLFRPVELGRHTGPYPRCSLRGATRTRGPRSQPDGGDHRQPKRQSLRKRGASIDPIGFDAGKKTKGIKRHILTDHQGLLLSVAVHPASVQDRDGAELVLSKRVRRRFPFIKVIFADAGYQGPRVRDTVRKSGAWRIEIVKRPDAQKGFAVIAKRWIVVRTLAWISRNRRLARDFENLARTATALIRLAMIKLMLRRLCRT